MAGSPNLADMVGTAWSSLFGKPIITVSPVGLINGGSSTNNGADYGPDTSGTATMGIQEAINAVSTSGGIVYLLPGSFYLTAFLPKVVSWIDQPNILLNGVSGVAIIGAPGGDVVITPNNGSNYSDILVLYECSDIVVAGIRFLGNSYGPLTGNAGGLAIESSQRVHVVDCHFDSFHGSAIVGDWIFDSTFDRLLINTSIAGANAIYRGFDFAFIQNIVVRDSSVALDGGYGFNVFYNSITATKNNTGRLLNESNSSNQIRLVNSIWFGCGTGIVLSDTIDSAIIDCDVYLNTVTGILVISNTTLVSPKGNEFLGCRIWQNGSGSSNQGGAQINSNSQSSVEVRIADCDFYDNNALGLAIVNPSNIVICRGTLFRNRYTSNQQLTAIGGTSGPIIGVGLLAGSLIVNCPGYNPGGFAIAQYSAGGPGIDVPNPNPFPVMVYITGVGSGMTGYGITDANSNLVSFTAAVALGWQFRIDPGGKIRLYYSTGVPTWKWEGL